jgi:hypothetical protein
MPQELRVVSCAGAGVASTWRPAGRQPMSVAAVCGRHVAIGSESGLHCLRADPASGALSDSTLVLFPQQISALTLFEVPRRRSGGLGPADVWVAVGQWVTNEVRLQRLGSSGCSAAAATAVLPGQPRSLVVADLAGASFLFVGTSSGHVVYYAMLPTAEDGITLGVFRLCPWLAAPCHLLRC